MSARDEPPSSHASVRRQALQAEVATEETNLRRLEAEQAEAKARLTALQSDLAALDVAPTPVREPVTSLANGPRTPTDKVKLFCYGEHPITERVHVLGPQQAATPAGRSAGRARPRVGALPRQRRGAGEGRRHRREPGQGADGDPEARGRDREPPAETRVAHGEDRPRTGNAGVGRSLAGVSLSIVGMFVGAGAPQKPWPSSHLAAKHGRAATHPQPDHASRWQQSARSAILVVMGVSAWFFLRPQLGELRPPTHLRR